MSWGGGDIIAISQLAVKVYTAYKDAPINYKNISEEVKSLQMMVMKAGQHLKSTTLSDNNRQLGQEVLRSCQSVLEDLNSLIKEYNSVSANTHQVFKRVRLGAEDITTLRARLISNTGLLNGFIQRFDSPTIRYYSVYDTNIFTLVVSCMKCKHG